MGNPPAVSISFLLFFQILFTSGVISYTPVDNFFVNCGSSGNSPLGGQIWTGDIDSVRFSPVEFTNSNNSLESAKGLGKIIPYDTARPSRSEFSYLFPLKTYGQKFIRLYFYSYSYDLNFLRSDSVFSVRVGSHTLLKDFNASVTADDVDKETILREYCVNIFDPSEGLFITFTPSPSHPNAYAFVNGIEVVSMPTFLYYTKPDDLQSMLLNDGTQQYPVKNNRALETVYRINVDGSQIPPQRDTGMFRYWDQDISYLERERSFSVSAGFFLKADHKDYQNYFLPDQVYLTAPNYGMKDVISRILRLEA